MRNNNDQSALATKQSPEQKLAFRKPDYFVAQEDNAYRLEVQLPGVRKDAARITLDGNLLTIEADAPHMAEEGWKAFRREIPEGGFKLSLELNIEIDEENIAARTHNGVLIVTLPLAAKAAKRTITIE